MALLDGYKTYIMAVALGVDALGAKLGWWPADGFRTIIEQVLALAFLRQAVK